MSFEIDKIKFLVWLILDNIHIDNSLDTFQYVKRMFGFRDNILNEKFVDIITSIHYGHHQQSLDASRHQ